MTKRGSHVPLREAGSPGSPGRTSNTLPLTPPEPLAWPCCWGHSSFFCKLLSWILPEGFLSMKTPPCLAWNEAWEREIIERQLIWASPFPRGGWAAAWEARKWRKWAGAWGRGVGQALPQGSLRVLLPYPSLVHAPSHLQLAPWRQAKLNTNISLNVVRGRKLALSERGGTCQSSYRWWKGESEEAPTWKRVSNANRPQKVASVLKILWGVYAALMMSTLLWGSDTWWYRV